MEIEVDEWVDDSATPDSGVNGGVAGSLARLPDRPPWDQETTSAQLADASRRYRDLLDLPANWDRPTLRASHHSPYAPLEPPARERKPGMTEMLLATGPGATRAQNALLFQTIQTPVLTASMPAVATGVAAGYIAAGGKALAEGDYRRALSMFAGALDLLGPARQGQAWRVERQMHRAAWTLHDDLERAVLNSVGSRRRNLTIGVGVITDDLRNARVVVSVNGNASKRLANAVRTESEQRGIAFVGGQGMLRRTSLTSPALADLEALESQPPTITAPRVRQQREGQLAST